MSAAVFNLFGGVLIQKKRAEEALEASGIRYTIIRCTTRLGRRALGTPLLSPVVQCPLVWAQEQERWSCNCHKPACMLGGQMAPVEAYPVAS